MKLIADSGSTKTEWCLIQAPDNTRIITSEGINPYYQSTEDVEAIIEKNLVPVLEPNQVTEIYYYGAGCSNESKKQIVHRALSRYFPAAHTEVDHDVMAAARSLCNREPGMVAILGTGSNSVLFDGEKIIANVPSLGFTLGDEGSGGYIGKELIKQFLYGELDSDVHHRFEKEYELNKDAILEKVYHQPLPNRFMAGFTRFVHEHISNPGLNRLVILAFEEFIQRHISKYPDYRNTPLHCTGSVAFVFKDQLQQACINKQVSLGRVVKNPLNGLVQYHLHQ
ncbi:MAG: N-acetylglucosamine kinase [Bacteroidia bacterium]|nr:N-acetylglucosamine kinase [Bacteroidia bacterium]